MGDSDKFWTGLIQVSLRASESGEHGVTERIAAESALRRKAHGYSAASGSEACEVMARNASRVIVYDGRESIG